jgi:hypothetical protein
MSLGEGPVSHVNGIISNTRAFANNIFWAYLDPAQPNVPNPLGFHQGGDGMQAILGALDTATGMFDGNAMNGPNRLNNVWMNPRLQIQEPGMLDVLRRQYDTEFHDRPANNNNPERLRTFTSRERVRGRASLFMPVDQTAADALRIGRVIPASAAAAIDNAWNDGFYTKDKGRPGTGVTSQFGFPTAGEQIRDFFGDPITNPPAVGAAQMPFSSKSYQPDPFLDAYRFITDPNRND